MFVWTPYVSGGLAEGSHLFPSRTQQLSPHTPMVLGWQRPGRVGSRRNPTQNTRTRMCAGILRSMLAFTYAPGHALKKARAGEMKGDKGDVGGAALRPTVRNGHVRPFGPAFPCSLGLCLASSRTAGARLRPPAPLLFLKKRSKRQEGHLKGSVSQGS